MNEIWTLLTQTPQNFRGGGIWKVIMDINGGLIAIGTALLVLFFVAGVVKTAGSVSELKRPEPAVKLFIRFVLAKVAITHGLEILSAIFTVCQGILLKISGSVGPIAQYTLPDNIKTAISNINIFSDFFGSIGLWALTFLGGLAITIISLIMIMTVYKRFFKLFMYTALAPIPLSTFAGEATSSIGKSFLKSYAAVCLEGAIIVLACFIFSVFAGSPPVATDPNASATTLVWNYVLELAFNMLVLLGAVKMSDRIVHEMTGI